MSVFIGERDVVLVRGADATTYLQGQLSQDVARLDVGESSWTLVLQPQGKVDAWCRVTNIGDGEFLLDIDAGFGDALVTRLERFRMRVKVEMELQHWDLHAYDEPLAEGNVIDAPIVAPSFDGLGVDVIGPALDQPAGHKASAVGHLRRRIEAGVPAMGFELDDSTIPAEAGIVNRSVSFTKGCYTGQELVARVDSRGSNTPRRLRIVSGTGPAPSPASELTADAKTAGVLTSVAPTDDGWVALAYIRRSALDRTILDLDENTVSVRPTPSDLAASGGSS